MPSIEPTNIPINAVAELIDLREQFEKRNAYSPPSGRWAYRGQPKDFGELTPSFQRHFSKRSSGAAQIIETKLIEAFRQHYRELPDRSADMPHSQQIDQGHDLRCLSVMQHYEIPTRLLDWTANFWTALYFACSNDPGNNAEMWIYDRELFSLQRNLNSSLHALMDRSTSPPDEPQLLSAPDNLIVELDPQISPRMRQQFAHHTVSTQIFSDHAALLRNLDSNTPVAENDSPRVYRILIDASCKARALQFLADTMHVNAGTIFPDVVGLGRFLRWQFDSLRTLML